MRFYKFLVITFFVFGIAFSSVSCKKGVEPKVDDKVENIEQSVTLDKKSATLVVGEELILTPDFGPIAAPKLTYQWKTDNPDVVSVSANDDYSAKITAIMPGTAKVTILSKDGRLVAICTIVVEEGEPVDDGVIRILAIGNSFSQDALDNYFYELAEKEGIAVVVGNLTIGGASLELHWQNANGNKANYGYRKIAQNGNVTSTTNKSIATALADEPWDYISFQQASPNSGQYNTFTTPLPLLYNYVRKKTTNPNVKYILHQTWAYAQNSTHAGFANYGRNQMAMYNAIVDAVGRAKGLINADIIIPAGTAIQNGRTSLIGDNFNRDGYHLDLNIGRYTAACTWFEAISGKNVIGNSFKPSDLSDYEAEIAQHAAHAAILKPNEVTEMVDYQNVGGSGILTDPVLIGFGTPSATSGWNSFIGGSNHTMGSLIANLKDKKDNFTGVSIAITEGFNGRNAVGEKGTTTDLDIPDNVSSSSYYGNPKLIFNGLVIEKSALKLSGLDKSKKYNLCFFGSRASVAAGENREAKYTVKGKNEVTVYLDAANNKSKTACANAVQPDDSGDITITITAGENNTNANGFYYINAMRIVLSE